MISYYFADSTGQPGVPDVSLPPPDSDPTACSRRELTVLPRAELHRPLLTAEASGIVSTDYTSRVNGNKSDKLGTVDSGRSSSDEAKPSGTATGRNGKFKLLDKIWQEFQETILQSTKQQPSDPHKGIYITHLSMHLTFILCFLFYLQVPVPPPYSF